MPSVVIEKRGNQRRVVWREGGRNSKRHVEAFSNRPQAEQFARDLRLKLAAALAPRSGRPIAWGELVQRYCNARGATTQAHRDQVQATLTALAKEKGWRTTSDVTMASAEGLGRYHTRLLRALLRYALGLDQAVDQRVLIAIRPRAAKQHHTKPLTDDQVSHYVATARNWGEANGAIAHVVATYGHRVESLVHLTVGAVDAPGRALRMKVKSGDTVLRPVTGETIRVLEPLMEGRASTDPLFISHLGQPWDSGKHFSAWWGHCIAAKDPERPGCAMRGHGIVAMRKYATTRLYRATKDAKTVADIQGRRTVALVLQIYAQSDDATMRAALDTTFGTVAQWSEQTAHNGLVPGSSPGSPTTLPPTVPPGATRKRIKLSKYQRSLQEEGDS